MDSLSKGEREISERVIQSMDIDRINRRHPSDVEIERNVVVVLGITGSGKSSLVNRMIGFELIPTGENMVTRTPINIRLHQSNEHNQSILLTLSIGFKLSYTL